MAKNQSNRDVKKTYKLWKRVVKNGKVTTIPTGNVVEMTHEEAVKKNRNNKNQFWIPHF